MSANDSVPAAQPAPASAPPRVEWALVAIVAAATILRLALGFVYFGFLGGDDVEILQAGLARALGRAHSAFTFRNLFVPHVLAAPAAWLAYAVGVRSVRTLLWVESWPFVALASANVVVVYALARRWLAGRWPALVAAGLYAFHWLPVAFGSMVYPRTASTTCVLLAALLTAGDSRPRLRAAGAGVLVGIAWACRYSEAIFLLPLVGVVAWRAGAWRDRLAAGASLLAGFAAASLVTVGLLDWLAWGTPFSSLATFAEYTLLQRRASSLVASQSWFWYLWRLPKWLPLTLLPLLWRSRRLAGAWRPASFVVLPLLALSAIHHKELRYLQGVLPFVVLLAAAGAAALWRDGRRAVTAVLVVLSLLWGIYGVKLVRRKSMAAVTAAQGLGRELRGGELTCLSQSWAYGNDLYLGAGAAIRELPYPLSASHLAGAGECSSLALYEQDLARDAGIDAALRARGLVPTRLVRWGRSKPVVVYRRRERLNRLVAPAVDSAASRSTRLQRRMEPSQPRRRRP